MLEKESGKNNSYSRLLKKETVAPFELFDKSLVQVEEDLQHFNFFAPPVKKLNLAQQGLKAFFRSRARLSLYRRIVSYQNLGFLNKDMLPLSQKRMRGRINREIILTWNTNLSLSENLKPWIPEAEYVILNRAEETGYLQDGIKEIEKLLDYQTQIKDMLRDWTVLIGVLIGVYCLSFMFSQFI